MKKLFKLGLLSLLMGSLVVTSGCYKKDIDDLENRVNELEKTVETHQDAIDLLEVIVEGGLISKIEEGEDGFWFTITNSEGESERVYLPFNTPDLPDPAQIVKSCEDKGNYYELQIWNKEGATGNDYVVARIGKDFKFASSINVMTPAVKTTVGTPAYAIVDVNPASYELDPAKLDFDAIIVQEPSRAAATGLQEELTFVSVTRASDLTEDEWAVVLGATSGDGSNSGLTALEGRWVFEFEVTEKVGPVYYKLLVQFPKNAAEYNGLWKQADVPAVPATVEMDYSISDMPILFAEYIPNFITGSTDPADDTAIDIVVDHTADPLVRTGEMYSDGEVTAELTIANYPADPNLYLVDPTPTVTVTHYWANASDPVETSPAPADLNTYLVANGTAFAPGEDPVWKDVTFTMKADDQMPNFPIGAKVVYEITYRAVDANGTGITTPTPFTLTVTRVKAVQDLTTPTGGVYIPVDVDNVNYGPLAPAAAARSLTIASKTKIYDALLAMGYTQTQIAAATFTSLSVEEGDDSAETVWTAFTVDATTPEFAVVTDPAPSTTNNMVLKIDPTVPVGKYRLSYLFSIAGKTATVRDQIQIVAPTLYVKLKDAATNSLVKDIKPREGDAATVKAVRIFANTLDAVEVGSLLNLNTMQLGRTYAAGATGASLVDSEPGSVYKYEMTANPEELLDGTYGLRAEATTVELNNDGLATYVKLFVTLTTGQELPVVVNLADSAPYVANGTKAQNQLTTDWTNGAFYVAASYNGIASVTVNTTGYTFDMNNITDPAMSTTIADLITSVTLKDGTVINALPAYAVTDGTNTGTVASTVYQQLKRNTNFTVSIVTRLPIVPPTGGDINDQTNLITLVANDAVTENVANGNPAAFETTQAQLYVRGIKGFTAWTGTATQNLEVSVTDASGNIVTATSLVPVKLTHTGATPAVAL